MEYPNIQNDKNINQGPGMVFMTAANTAFSEAELKAIETLTDDGIEIGYELEDFRFSSNGLNVKECEETAIGINVKLTVMEISPGAFVKMLGFGDITTTAAAAAQAFTNQKVTCYGNNWTSLPINNVTLTAVTDNSATPVSYLTTDVEMDGVAGNNDGRIRIHPTSNIATDDEGVELLLTGTRNKRKTKYVDVGWDTDKKYYGMRIKKRDSSGKWQYTDIFKACSVGSPVVTYKVGEANVYSMEFIGILAPDQIKLYSQYYEID